jgi:hypothetical protein
VAGTFCVRFGISGLPREFGVVGVVTRLDNPFNIEFHRLLITELVDVPI